MIDATEIVFNGLLWVFLAAWRALPVFASVLVLTMMLRRRIPASHHCMLWMLVVVRLLLPVSVASPLALSPDPSRRVNHAGYTARRG